MQDWLTTRGLADLAGIHQDTVRQHILAGKIQAEKRGRDWFISAEDARKWLAQREERRKTE